MTKSAPELSYYPITGIQTGFGHHGELPMRHDINEWFESQDPIHIDQVSLFIAALKAFQEKPFQYKLSYFQVAGLGSKPTH